MKLEITSNAGDLSKAFKELSRKFPADVVAASLKSAGMAMRARVQRDVPKRAGMFSSMKPLDPLTLTMRRKRKANKREDADLGKPNLWKGVYSRVESPDSVKVGFGAQAEKAARTILNPQRGGLTDAQRNRAKKFAKIGGHNFEEYDRPERRIFERIQQHPETPRTVLNDMQKRADRMMKAAAKAASTGAKK